MFTESLLLTFYAETPIHMGVGQSVSFVDLPVQRERHTKFPVMWSSGIKGVFRDTAIRFWNDTKTVEAIFGPEAKAETNEESQEKDELFASCISITDAKILLYPVRSIKGVFGWITSPFVIQRFFDELVSTNLAKPENLFSIVSPSDSEVIVPQDSILPIIEKGERAIAFEEFVFNYRNDPNCDEIAKFLSKLLPDNHFTRNIAQRFAIVPDDVFSDFVNYAVEIRTRIRIDQETGTVKEGALFSEEFIPSETVFYSFMLFKDSFAKKEKANEDLTAKTIRKKFEDLFYKIPVVQLGGNETIGQGFVKIKTFVANNSGGNK